MDIEEEDNSGSRMTDHPNLYNKALTIIKRKGYKLFLWPEIDEESADLGTFFAKKGNRDFDAKDPLRLLGMICIWEEHGDEWYSNPKYKSEKILSELMDKAYPNGPEDYEKMSEEAFQTFVAECREFFTLGMFPDVEIPENISRAALFDIIKKLNDLPEEEE